MNTFKLAKSYIKNFIGYENQDISDISDIDSDIDDIEQEIQFDGQQQIDRIPTPVITQKQKLQSNLLFLGLSKEVMGNADKRIVVKGKHGEWDFLTLYKTLMYIQHTNEIPKKINNRNLLDEGLQIRETKNYHKEMKQMRNYFINRYNLIKNLEGKLQSLKFIKNGQYINADKTYKKILKKLANNEYTEEIKFIMNQQSLSADDRKKLENYQTLIAKENQYKTVILGKSINMLIVKEKKIEEQQELYKIVEKVNQEYKNKKIKDSKYVVKKIIANKKNTIEQNDELLIKNLENLLEDTKFTYKNVKPKKIRDENIYLKSKMVYHLQNFLDISADKAVSLLENNIFDTLIKVDINKTNEKLNLIQTELNDYKEILEYLYALDNKIYCSPYSTYTSNLDINVKLHITHYHSKEFRNDNDIRNRGFDKVLKLFGNDDTQEVLDMEKLNIKVKSIEKKIKNIKDEKIKNEKNIKSKTKNRPVAISPKDADYKPEIRKPEPINLYKKEITELKNKIQKMQKNKNNSLKINELEKQVKKLEKQNKNELKMVDNFNKLLKIEEQLNEHKKTIDYLKGKQKFEIKQYKNKWDGEYFKFLKLEKMFNNKFDEKEVKKIMQYFNKENKVKFDLKNLESESNKTLINKIKNDDKIKGKIYINKLYDMIEYKFDEKKVKKIFESLLKNRKIKSGKTKYNYMDLKDLKNLLNKQRIEDIIKLKNRRIRDYEKKYEKEITEAKTYNGKLSFDKLLKEKQELVEKLKGKNINMTKEIKNVVVDEDTYLTPILLIEPLPYNGKYMSMYDEFIGSSKNEVLHHDKQLFILGGRYEEYGQVKKDIEKILIKARKYREELKLEYDFDMNDYLDENKDLIKRQIKFEKMQNFLNDKVEEFKIKEGIIPLRKEISRIKKLFKNKKLPKRVIDKMVPYDISIPNSDFVKVQDDTELIMDNVSDIVNNKTQIIKKKLTKRQRQKNEKVLNEFFNTLRPVVYYKPAKGETNPEFNKLESIKNKIIKDASKFYNINIAKSWIHSGIVNHYMNEKLNELNNIKIIVEQEEGLKQKIEFSNIDNVIRKLPSYVEIDGEVLIENGKFVDNEKEKIEMDLEKLKIKIKREIFLNKIKKFTKKLKRKISVTINGDVSRLNIDNTINQLFAKILDQQKRKLLTERKGSDKMIIIPNQGKSHTDFEDSYINFTEGLDDFIYKINSIDNSNIYNHLTNKIEISKKEVMRDIDEHLYYVLLSFLDNKNPAVQHTYQIIEGEQESMFGYKNEVWNWNKKYSDVKENDPQNFRKITIDSIIDQLFPDNMENNLDRWIMQHKVSKNKTIFELTNFNKYLSKTDKTKRSKIVSEFLSESFESGILRKQDYKLYLASIFLERLNQAIELSPNNTLNPVLIYRYLRVLNVYTEKPQIFERIKKGVSAKRVIQQERQERQDNNKDDLLNNFMKLTEENMNKQLTENLQGNNDYTQDLNQNNDFDLNDEENQIQDYEDIVDDYRHLVEEEQQDVDYDSENELIM